MSTVNRVGNAFVVLVVVLLVGVFAVQAFPQAVGADESFVVLSGSMEPEISTGDVVIVDAVPPTSVAEGDVITYRRSDSGTPITHRVLDVQETDAGLQFVTKGDANEDADPGLVSADTLVGRVTFVLPYVGYVVDFANTRLGKLVLVGLPFGILALTEAVSIVRGRGRGESGTAKELGQDGGTRSGQSAAGPVDDTSVSSSAEDTEPTGSFEAESTEEDVSITTTDLRLSGVTFGVFAAYASAMAYQHPGGLTVGVAVAAVCGVLLIVLVYFVGEPEASETAQPTGLTDGGVGPPRDEESSDSEGDSP